MRYRLRTLLIVPRVSLRALLVFLTVACIALGFAADKCHRRGKALALLGRHYPNHVEFSPTGWMAEALAPLVPQPLLCSVSSVSIRGQPLDRDLLWAIAQIGEVQEVSLVNSHVSPVECEALACMGLKSVTFHGCTLDEGAIQALSRSRCLTKVSCAFSNATDGDCRWLSQCTSLTHVCLSGCNVTDSGLNAIGQLPRLTHLAISPENKSQHAIELLLTRHPRLFVQCYGVADFGEEWWTSLRQRFPMSRVHR
jgi:hypothetical protein